MYLQDVALILQLIELDTYLEEVNENMSKKQVVSSTINGQQVEFLTEPQQSLLECLRDTLGLTGSKEGCNDGNCGACSVLIDDRLVNACLVLGIEIDGKDKDEILPQVEFTILSEGFDYLPIFFDDFKIKYKRVE